MIKVRMYPARNGDCFLISFGDKKKKHILIDCGYVNTYEKFLKKDLIKLADNNEKINLMIVTHIDADHISGAIKFIADNNKNKFIKIDEVWFNAYRHLQHIRKSNKELRESEREILEREIALGKSFLKRINQDEIAKDEISAKQGSNLGALLLKGQYNWNTNFDGNAVIARDNEDINIDDIKINVLSPSEEKIKKLEEQWVKELKKRKWNFNITTDELFDDAYEFMQMMDENGKITVSNISKQGKAEHIKLEDYIDMEYANDDSVNNGSSIAILIKYKEKKLLLLADAHPDIILEQLNKMGERNFNLVKVPHHGSMKNTTNELARNLLSNRYLFSTNGYRHQHPDPQTIIKLLFSNQQCEKQLYFNYKTKTSSIFESKELQDRYNYQIITGNGEEPLVIEI
ncbi:MBL fold metallo-hydrolase [Priestia megaterium]